MINTNYLQMLKVDEDIQHVYLESVQEIEDIVSPIRVLEMRRQQEMDLGIFTEAADTLYTEGVKEAVTKIGDKIIEIVKRIKDFIKSIPDKIKEATWSKSDVDKKMNIIKKQDPKKFEEIKVYVDKGMLDFNTFESMKKFYDGYDELLAELKKKEVDEKSLKGKLENTTMADLVEIGFVSLEPGKELPDSMKPLTLAEFIDKAIDAYATLESLGLV